VENPVSSGGPRVLPSTSVKQSLLSAEDRLLNIMPRVLIADDQPAVIEALRLLLKGEGFETRTVASPADAAEALARQTFDVALIDLNYARDTTSGAEGLDLLASWTRRSPSS
jgi:CheY-like chemotaxis protein